jgi:hypothetical protein
VDRLGKLERKRLLAKPLFDFKNKKKSYLLVIFAFQPHNNYWKNSKPHHNEEEEKWRKINMMENMTIGESFRKICLQLVGDQIGSYQNII